MKNIYRVLLVCLLAGACLAYSGAASAQTAGLDTLSWSWEVSSTASTHTKTLTIAFTGNLMVNWGDGVTEWIPDTMSSKTISHYYEAQSNYECSAIGHGITYFKADSRRLLTLNTSKSPMLNYISCTSNQLTSLDVSKNAELVSLYCSGNDISVLGLSSNTKLQTLTCSDNKIVSLDLSMLQQLKKATVHTNLLTSIKVSPTGALTYLSCLNCKLEAPSLDSIFNQLPVLTEVSASKNLFVMNNPGSSSCHSEIAAGKKWTLDRVITQSSVYMPSVSGRINDSVKVSVFVKNTSPAMAFEFDIQIPSGFQLDTARTSLEASRVGSHILSQSLINPQLNVYKFMAFSMKNKDVFKGSEGALLNLYLKTPSSLATYAVDISKAILIDSLTNVMDITITDGSINLTTAALMGDANNDGRVNVTDITFLVAWINGKNPVGFSGDASDMDGNGVWNIADITKMVEVINSGSLRSGQSEGRVPVYYRRENALEGNHMYLIQKDDEPFKLELFMSNPEDVKALQTDIILPEHFSFKSVVNFTGRANNYIYSLVRVSNVDNRWRFIAYSLRPDDAIKSDEGVLAVIELENILKAGVGDCNIFLESAVFTGSSYNELSGFVYDAEMHFDLGAVNLSDYELTGTAKKINISANKNLSVVICDLPGKSVLNTEISKGHSESYNVMSGIYLLKLTPEGNKTEYKKIIVP